MNRLPNEEDALVEVDAVETALSLISSVSVTLCTVEGTTHSRLFQRRRAPWIALFQLHCYQERLLVAETLFHVYGHPVHMDETPRSLSLCVERLHPVCIQVTSRLERVRDRLTEALSQVFNAETSLNNSLAQCLGRCSIESNF